MKTYRVAYQLPYSACEAWFKASPGGGLDLGPDIPLTFAVIVYAETEEQAIGEAALAFADAGQPMPADGLYNVAEF